MQLTHLRWKPYARRAVKRFFHLVLLVSALFGFVAQGIAMAMAPGCDMAMPRMAAEQSAKAMPMPMSTPMNGKMACCPEAHSGKADPQRAEDIMPHCPMISGCFVSLAMGSTPALPAMIPIEADIADWPLAAQLANRATAPEPPPPTL